MKLVLNQGHIERVGEVDCHRLLDGIRWLEGYDERRQHAAGWYGVGRRSMGIEPQRVGTDWDEFHP
jgi:hypothetical protein